MTQERPKEISDAYTEDDIRVIAATVAPDLSAEEMTMFLHNCTRSGLDPLGRQIYAIKRGGKLSIQTGIDGFRLIAERTGRYAPGRDTEFIYDDNKRLMGAKVYVKKMTADGTWHEVSATAFMQEYNAGNHMWRKLPHQMISKVAESIALRRCFPAELSGLYTSEEMDQAAKTHGDSIDNASINSVDYEKLMVFLDEHPEYVERLKKLCATDDLRKLTRKQLTSCRLFVKNHMATIKKDTDDEDSKE